MSLPQLLAQGKVSKSAIVNAIMADTKKLNAPVENIKALVSAVIANPKKFVSSNAYLKALKFVKGNGKKTQRDYVKDINHALAGDGFFSSALNKIKSINNKVHDIPIIASKPLRAVVQTVGKKVGGPVEKVAKVVDKAISTTAQIASLAPKQNPDWEYKWRTKQTSENHALIHDGPPPLWRLYRAKYAGQMGLCH